MFQLLKFSENPETPKVDVLVEYDLLKGGTNKTEASHDTKAIAARWVEIVQTKYIQEHLKAFIRHKVILSERSSTWTDAINKTEKLLSLELCRRELNACVDYPLDSICSVVLLLEKHLINILPMPYNKSYKSSKYNLDAILEFCKEYLHGPKNFIQ